MNATSQAVFISYASQDVEAAEHISEALRAVGIEVWFDQGELRAGDAWDWSIRQHIQDCRLFIAIISAHTEARDEGYFRREWKLAVDRTRDMAEDRTFLVPVVIDGISERIARVPEPFKQVQWTRLRGGETPRAFVERVKRLLCAVSPRNIHGAESTTAIFEPEGSARRTTAAAFPFAEPSGSNTLCAPAIPEKSVAVLPFIDMSENKDQEYFSDGLAEELIDALAKVPNLRVPARTSSFSFKGKAATIGGDRS